MDKTKYLKFSQNFNIFHTFRMAFPTFCNSQGFSYDYVFDWNTKKNVSGVKPLENGSCSLKTLTAFFVDKSKRALHFLGAGCPAPL